jgi:hypothetical protein
VSDITWVATLTCAKTVEKGAKQGKMKANPCLRHAFCYFANDLRYGNVINRRWRQRLNAVTAAFSLALWLLMTVAESYPAFHAWLHGGSIPDNDDCAVVAIAHAKVQVVTCDAPMVIPVLGVEIVPRPVAFASQPATTFLPDGRGPPVLFVVS